MMEPCTGYEILRDAEGRAYLMMLRDGDQLAASADILRDAITELKGEGRSSEVEQAALRALLDAQLDDPAPSLVLAPYVPEGDAPWEEPMREPVVDQWPGQAEGYEAALRERMRQQRNAAIDRAFGHTVDQSLPSWPRPIVDEVDQETIPLDQVRGPNNFASQATGPLEVKLRDTHVLAKVERVHGTRDTPSDLPPVSFGDVLIPRELYVSDEWAAELHKALHDFAAAFGRAMEPLQEAMDRAGIGNLPADEEVDERADAQRDERDLLIDALRHVSAIDGFLQELYWLANDPCVDDASKLREIRKRLKRRHTDLAGVPLFMRASEIGIDLPPDVPTFEDDPEGDGPARHEPVGFHLNDTVKVKLSRYGRDYLKLHAQHLNSTVLENIEDDGFYHDTLWRLISIFGPAINISCQTPFEGEIIRVRNTTEENQ